MRKTLAYPMLPAAPVTVTVTGRGYRPEARIVAARLGNEAQDLRGLIERLERDPIPYTEQRPRRDLAGLAYAASLVGLVILVAAKLGEADLSRSGLSAARSRATASDPARRAA